MVSAAMLATVLPTKAADRKRLAHCPAVKVVGVDIQNVLVSGFRAVVAHSSWDIRGGLPPANPRNAAPHPLFDEKVFIDVGEQLQFDTGVLEQRVPGEPRGGDVVRRIEPIGLKAELSMGLINVGQQGNIAFQVEVVVVPHVLAAKFFPTPAARGRSQLLLPPQP